MQARTVDDTRGIASVNEGALCAVACHSARLHSQREPVRTGESVVQERSQTPWLVRLAENVVRLRPLSARRPPRVDQGTPRGSPVLQERIDGIDARRTDLRRRCQRRQQGGGLSSPGCARRLRGSRPAQRQPPAPPLQGQGRRHDRRPRGQPPGRARHVQRLRGRLTLQHAEHQVGRDAGRCRQVALRRPDEEEDDLPGRGHDLGRAPRYLR